MRTLILLLLVLALAPASPASLPDSIRVMIVRGDFSRAQAALRTVLQQRSVTGEDSALAAFEIERLDRIRKDFRLKRDDVLRQLEKVFGDGAAHALQRHTADGSLEMMTIDGEPRYFNRAVPNLYRVNASARRVKEAKAPAVPDSLKRFLRLEIPRTLAWMEKEHALRGPEKAIRFTYTLTVKADAVPEGETIRCWLPYPRSDAGRQTEITLLKTIPSGGMISSDAYAHKTAYFERKAVRGTPTVFAIEVQYRSAAERALPEHLLSGSSVADSLKPFTGERPPHIVFTPRIVELNKRIVGKERDRLRVARAIFSWISENIPWASAREYSTIPGIAEYCAEQKHGDCGIQTLLFMTLCRLNGIPARWESGWMMHPGNENMHDWCEISLDGAHWVPVDQSFGLQGGGTRQDVRFFYLGGMDAYRLIVNKEYGGPLFPPKLHPRSETVDFQRGEVEWKGGNLYFDQWNWSMDVSYPGVSS